MSASDTKPDNSSEMLPEVQPPTTGFILQLFIIPGLIVFMIVLVWLMIGWVSDASSTPQEYLAEIKKGRSNSWQQALALAQTLQKDPQSKNDPELARQIAEYLNTLLDQALPPEKDASSEKAKQTRDERAEGARLRQYLCIALSNFSAIDLTLPVLLKAANIDSGDDENEIKVRVAALNSIAKLAENSKNLESLHRPEVLTALLIASEDDQSVIVNSSIMALGMLQTDEAVERLEEMALEGQLPNVRYNIGTALARNGRESSVELLLEMLQPDKIDPLPDAPEERKLTAQERQQRRELEKSLVVLAALQAVPLLVEKNEQIDRAPLIAVIEKLPASDMPSQVQLQAKQLLRELKKTTEE